MYVFPEQGIEYHGEEGTPFEGAWVKVKQVRLGADIEAIAAAEIVADLHAVIAPFILAWNISGKQVVEVEVPAVVDADGKELVAARTRKESQDVELPPPAEAGPDILLAIRPEVRTWIVERMVESIGYRKQDPKASATESRPSLDGEPSETPSDSPMKTKPRTSRGS